MPTTEHTINDALAALLRETRRAWRRAEVVRSENTGMLKDSAKRPDILVVEPNVSPVTIETEVLPATTVESDAVARLGARLRATGRPILSSIAVRLPTHLRTRSGAQLTKALGDVADLDLALYTGESATSFQRWPPSGWVSGTIADLSLLTQSATIPPGVIADAAGTLVEGVSEAAGLMAEMAETHPGAIHKISEELLQEDGEQTRRMASTILVNAVVFHDSLAGGPGELRNIQSLDQLRAGTEQLEKSAILNEWQSILQINYWAIFDVARRILEVIPLSHSPVFLETLAETARRLLQRNLMRSHDLTGHVFQTLIADRKFLAAYYTTPASASLLAALSVSHTRPLGGAQWSDIAALQSLRIADFACGTGTLLATAYQRIGQLHELAGGDAEALHPEMMKDALVGCDVLPAATHLTASMLSGAHPTIKYENTNILTVLFGRQPDGEIRLGSLDLLDEQGRVENAAITARAVSATGEQETETWWSLKHDSFDYIIMNPPFTRDTGHEGKKVGISNPMFAAFKSTKHDQRAMAQLLKGMTKGSSAHGNAGEGSIFLVLANRKLKIQGTLALVLPLSLLSGEAWEKSRRLLTRNYADIIVVSIAGAADREISFSADTDMAECLVIGRKVKAKASATHKRATFVILNERPATPMLGSVAGRQITELMSKDQLRRLEDGPVGGSAITFGDTIIGHAITAPVTEGEPWHSARLADVALG